MTSRAVENVEMISDDDLARLALSADPRAPLADDAVPISQVIGPARSGPLPSWYMPAPMGVPAVSGWRRRVVTCGAFSVILSFVTITAAGLCNTYGQLHL